MNKSQEKLIFVQDKMAKAAKLARRKAEDINLIAISKTRVADEIRPLLDAGHRLFGENRVQEAEEKWPALREEYCSFDGQASEEQADVEPVKVHLVGQLQSNKAEDAVRLFDAIHSLDRPSLVKALAKAMDKLDRRIPCFIQVNIGEEPQKGGCEITDVPKLIEATRLADIEVPGLMCIPPSQVHPAPYFALLAKLAKDNELTGLSMGMSGDFETAVKLGATHIRVGTALFGERG
ncbi:YggS family pyridoxal phosphate-dependent enzyme [Parasphingorhabdus sp. JC815]|uniref:YggS family pyridoxal phosphate-dependent enzyme n=1 Tax=Parasphingorhabdus sp. JC815 TaxID=3232140 RepID=UPI003457E3D1